MYLYVRVVKYCDRCLTKIHVPHDFNGAVKGLNQVKQWKGLFTLPWLFPLFNTTFSIIFLAFA